MIGEILISIITLAIIAALVVWLIMQPQKRVLQIGVPICVVSFAVIYVFYLVAFLVPGDPLFGIPATFQAFLESFLSFTNGVAYSDIVESEMMQSFVGTFWFETVFWALHMLVIITLAISGFAVFGRKIMDRARVALIQKIKTRDVYHIFGDTQGALVLGENLSNEKDKPLVVFYSSDYTEELREDIAAFGGALIEIDDEAKDDLINRAKAKNPGNVAVFETGKHVRVNGDLVSMLLARKMVHDNPPYKAMGMEMGFPDRPFECVVIGFGELGQACAKHVIANAQMSPNDIIPHVLVVDRDPIEFEKFQIEHPSISLSAKIDYLSVDAYSFAFENALLDIVETTKGPDCIYVTCAPATALNSIERTAHAECNDEIMKHVKGILARTGRFDADRLEAIFVNPCIDCSDIWTSSIILHKSLDAQAVRLNGNYSIRKEDLNQMNSSEREEAFAKAWEGCSEFHKDSSRASCDFMNTMVMIAGVDPESLDAKERFSNILQTNETLLEELSHIEHARWNAFHACNGYSPMEPSEFEERVHEFVKAKESGVEKPPAAHQNPFTKRHVCMVSWDELPALESLYGKFDEKIANGETTLQGRDADNVRMVPDLLETH